ncbi:MAG TPA: phosphoenolpyruvate hydrolase family protein [Pseudonocardiaceae bacterium]
MATRFPRDEVIARLRAEIARGRPVLMFGAGTALTARCAQAGGADLIGVYSTAI